MARICSFRVAIAPERRAQLTAMGIPGHLLPPPRKSQGADAA
jgi:hypothetical protein